jgi:hypothetical protein
MSETLEQRLRRLAKLDNATICKVYPGDVIDLLDERDIALIDAKNALLGWKEIYPDDWDMGDVTALKRIEHVLPRVKP